MSNVDKMHDVDPFLAHLVEANLLTNTNAERVRRVAVQTSTEVPKILVELGMLEEEDAFQALATFTRQDFVTTEMIDNRLVLASGLSTEFLRRVSALPAKQDNGVLTLAVASQDTKDLLESVAFKLNLHVCSAIATPSTIRTVLDRLGDTVPESNLASDEDLERLQSLANDGPVIKLVNDLIADALTANASDIHVEAKEIGSQVRFRLDGRLMVERQLSSAFRLSVASRIKVLAGLNISEKRLPQSGRFESVVKGRRIDVRASTLPTQFGESIVMRLLDKTRHLLSWDRLGFAPNRIAQIRDVISQPNGIFLVAGPTGSGKTTTLYTALNEINTSDKKIITVEDPVEYSLEGINQVQVDEAIGLTFAEALRAVVRQDPNVVMIGEIRDQETAEIAIRAALLGRLVISTIHTNDSVSSINRLRDLGIPDYLLADTLRAVLSQRLVRKTCSACGGEGCGRCRDSGVVGRMVMSEFLEVTQKVASAIHSGGFAGQINEIASKEGFVDMRAEGRQLVAQRLVSNKEVALALGGSVMP